MVMKTKKRLSPAATVALWTDDFARELDAVLHSPAVASDAYRGYYVGLVTVLMVTQTGLLPTRSMLERAGDCKSITEALTIAEGFVLEARKGRAAVRAN